MPNLTKSWGQQMVTMDMVWTAIDNIAAANDMSTSGLARHCGLDATTFNKSKRHTRDGDRCLSMTTILRVLNKLGMSLAEFEKHMNPRTK